MLIRDIEINYRREYLEEIYFRNGAGKGWLNPNYRKERIAILVVLSLLLGGLYYTAAIEPENRLFVIPAIFIVPVIVDFIIKVHPHLKWEKEVRQYLNRLENSRHFHLIITENAMTYKQDDKETTEKWIHVKSVEIESSHIIINASHTYLFPQRCMRPDDFQFLKEFVAAKVR